MFTPRQPVRRRLNFTPYRTPKRPRISGPVAIRAYRANFKHVLKGPKTTGTLAAQVKSLQKIVKLLAPEKKYFDVSINATNITTAGSVTNLVGIAQGDGITNRTGNAVNVTNITCKGIFERGSSALAAIGYKYRVLVVVDKQQIADTAPAAGDIIADAAYTANPLTCLPNTANLERFRILWTSPLMEMAKGCVTAANVAGTAAVQTGTFEWTWSGSIKVEYNGANAADIQKNGIYIVYLTDDGNNTLDATGISRIGFTDV